jgi:transposase InsO family protein
MIPPSWPFAVWGVEILGPFPRAVGGYRFLFVAIDKFTKWPEATPMVNITQGAAVAFLKSIVCRFGVPSRIITDNGTQFTSRIFQEYCENIGTQLCFASVAHPRSNNQVERENAEILKGLKTRTYDCLKKHGENWVSELPSVLWGNRATPSRATGETPFFLVYGAEACLPPEILMGSCNTLNLGYKISLLIFTNSGVIPLFTPFPNLLFLFSIEEEWLFFICNYNLVG